MTLPRTEGGPPRSDERHEAERGLDGAAGRAAGQMVARDVELEATPGAVWDALTEPALLAEWLADEVEIEAEPGGEIVCRYADGEERRGEVELAEEGERLAWRWRRPDGAPSRVELVLDAVAAGTRLTVIETAPPRATGPLLGAAAWAAPLGRLRAAARLVLA